MKTYTVADLRKDTRKILNEASTEPILITRYDETFVLSKSTGEKFKLGTTQIPGGHVVVDEATHLTDKEVDTLQKKIIKKPSDVGVAVPGACVHGAAKGFCKVQKCPNSKR